MELRLAELQLFEAD